MRTEESDFVLLEQLEEELGISLFGDNLVSRVSSAASASEADSVSPQCQLSATQSVSPRLCGFRHNAASVQAPAAAILQQLSAENEVDAKIDELHPPAAEPEEAENPSSTA